MKKVLLDISVVLNLVLNRAPWAADASTIWNAHIDNRLQLFLAAFSLPTIFYIVRRQVDLAAAREAVRVCLATLEILPIDQAMLKAAWTMPGPDFEDNLQVTSAVQAGLDIIIIRDPRGFSGAPIPVLSPGELCAQISGTASP